MKIYVGADHNGFTLKDQIIAALRREKYDVVDKGNEKLNPTDDFPQFAGQVVTEILTSDDDEPRGILICGSGQGMCMAANRFNGIRASLVWDIYEAKASRNDDDSNILCLPARVLKEKDALLIINTWLTTSFAGAQRFIRRIKELDELN